VNAYFGRDGVIGTEKNPIFSTWFKNGKGLFVLIKTSNDSSSQIQNLIIQRTSGSKKDKSVKGPCELYQYIADLVENWGAEYDYSIGGVVGATYPEELKKIRRIMSGILLLPGFGVQGGDVDILNHVVQDQKFSIINSSRSVMYAYALRSEQFKEEDFAKASRKEVERMNAEINKYIPL